MTTTSKVSSSLLVGRREEVAQLERLLDRARSREAAGVVVAGDAGIGKTRLVDELAERATRVGGLVAVGGCVELGAIAVPYAPFIEILRALLRSQGVGTVLELAGPTASELGRLLPELAVGAEPPPATRASASQLYVALLALFEGLARRRPLVLVVEDLHWADRTSRDLLALLIRNLRGAIMTVLTVRTDEAPTTDALGRFLAELERAGTPRLTLGPLAREDQARQLAAILGVPPRPALVDDIYRRAEGNPFFAEELLALGGASGELPRGVRDLLFARVESLDDTTRTVLRAAAVAGRRVSHRLLAAALNLDDDVLDTGLRAAVGANVLVPEGDGRLVFRHALLRETIEASVVPSEATRLHRRLAETLTADASLAGDDGHAVASRIAHHWERSGDEEQVLVASLRAAAAAEEALAFPAALEHYERAVAIIDRRDDLDHLLGRPRYQVLWWAAESAHLAAFPERAAALVRAAIAAISRSPDHVDVELHHAYLHERLGRYLWMAADGHGAMAAYQRAVELVPTEPPSCWQAAIYSGYGQMLMLSSRFAESLPWCEEAIALTRGLEDARSTEGHARNNLGVDLAFLGRIDEGIAQLREARRIAEEEFDDVDDIARAIVNLHSVLIDAGRLEEAADVALEGVAVTGDLGLERRKGVWCRCDAADALLRLGRWEETDRLTREALALEPGGVDAVRAHALRGRFHLARGEFTEASRHLDEARQRGEQVTDGQLNGPLHAALAELAISRGEPATALDVAEAGAQRLLAEEDPVSCVPVHAVAVRAAADLAERCRDRRDDPGEAAARAAAGRWLERAEAAMAREVADRPEPHAELLTGRAEHDRALGRHDPAAWDAAAAAWERLGQPARTAYARWRQAESALRAGHPTSRVQEVLAAAYGTAQALGATHLVEEIRTLARRARLRLDPGADTAPPAGGLDRYRLTRREREVLDLVAEGRTDRQIGEALFISHRTVERHVSNLLGKLGAATRSEATAIAHREAAAAT